MLVARHAIERASFVDVDVGVGDDDDANSFEDEFEDDVGVIALVDLLGFEEFDLVFQQD
jgi:hypothetical protein